MEVCADLPLGLVFEPDDYQNISWVFQTSEQTLSLLFPSAVADVLYSFSECVCMRVPASIVPVNQQQSYE